MSIKTRIAELRKKRGMSQGELAQLVGATQSMIGKLERGEREMTFSWLSRIAAALDVPTGDLIDATDEPAKVGEVDRVGLVSVSREPSLWNLPAGVPVEDGVVAEVHKSKIGFELSEDITLHLPAGSLLVYSGPQRKPGRDLAGRLVVAFITDDPEPGPKALAVRVGILMPGGDSKLYHLIPFSGPPLTDVVVHLVYEVSEIRL